MHIPWLGFMILIFLFCIEPIRLKPNLFCSHSFLGVNNLSLSNNYQSIVHVLLPQLSSKILIHLTHFHSACYQLKMHWPIHTWTRSMTSATSLFVWIPLASTSNSMHWLRNRWRSWFTGRLLHSTLNISSCEESLTSKLLVDFSSSVVPMLYVILVESLVYIGPSIT